MAVSSSEALAAVWIVNVFLGLYSYYVKQPFDTYKRVSKKNPRRMEALKGKKKKRQGSLASFVF